ncbi:acetate uptake transporter family protein NDAI_0H02430 [Naumovozyma dairenensis CBS 421]|uniref:Ammonia transport outward protein 2 n=1 Tax=Naumovozyma dairenensis (strain ATCC 10597 / BCRC 20456 / CBS 421 / NBRC 0211 / NRRL Y-12639) TaxID=1071378 RepID=G0WF56_NAUDC|nr:hypothetical protein NDAI_0H02430 [Naumovozyma dairenensis CBS 421]CCD26417.1 hypothetical protein NDAI_0H02430 [Naumovozyma dairenensis CBS 421]
MVFQAQPSGNTTIFEEKNSNNNEKGYNEDKIEVVHPYGITTDDNSNSNSTSTEDHDSVCKCYTTGANNEYVYIGHQKFIRNDLTEAFGGTLNPGLSPPSHHKFANPAPLGLCGFALTTFLSGMFNARAQGIQVHNVIVGCAIFYGGLVQLIAGIWEIALENTFGGTALCSYGGYWMSYGAIYIPWFGILDAYKEDESDFANAMGIYLLSWSIFTFGLTFCTLKSTVMFSTLFFLVALTYLLNSISEFTGSPKVQRAGGIVGIIVSFLAWYNAYTGVANRENSYIVITPLQLPSNDRTIY